MPFRAITPPPQAKPHMHMQSTPISGYGRSPSLDPPSFTTDDLAAARYGRFSRMLEWLRICLAALTLVVGIAVTACVGVALRSYSSAHVQPEWLLPVWPHNVDLRPLHAMLGTGIVVMVFSLGYIAVAFAPLPGKAQKLNLASAVLAGISFILALFSTIFAAVVAGKVAGSSSSGTLNSWTCRWQGYDHAAPLHFDSICNNSSASYDLMMLLVVLEFLVLAAAGAGFAVEKKHRASAGRGISKVELV